MRLQSPSRTLCPTSFFSTLPPILVIGTTLLPARQGNLATELRESGAALSDACISPIGNCTKKAEFFVDRPCCASCPVFAEIHHAENGCRSALDLTISLHQTESAERLIRRESVGLPLAGLAGSEVKFPITHPHPSLHAATTEATFPIKEDQRFLGNGGAIGAQCAMGASVNFGLLGWRGAHLVNFNPVSLSGYLFGDLVCNRAIAP